MSRRVQRTSTLSYYRTALPALSLDAIPYHLEYESSQRSVLPAAAVSLLGHVRSIASPGRTIPRRWPSALYPMWPRPSILDILVVTHKDRTIFYLNATQTFPDPRGGLSMNRTGTARDINLRTVTVGGHELTLFNADPAFAVLTNMPARTSPPKYSLPHVLAGSSMKTMTALDITVTGDYTPSMTRDIDHHVPDGFEQVDWSSPRWSSPVCIPGEDFDDDMNPQVESSICSHVEVTGDDHRVASVFASSSSALR